MVLLVLVASFINKGFFNSNPPGICVVCDAFPITIVLLVSTFTS